ncbi:hypothetical protein PR048_014967 [Dryococelus australis]|uniref:Uncharacterized protein n=1 Tax=Dryococelus australis TaxID=614101 RepID=A0ABQ9HFM2_9NEOP|nr:hypothetical protein PR048_014967 [Dryococelus australis]
MKGRGKRENPVKTRRAEATSGTIPICENTESNCSKMADEGTLLLSGSAKKELNNGLRSKIRLSEFKDNKNKALRNAGKPYRNRKGTDIFRSEFKIRFGPPRSDSCSYCDELYIHLVAAETEDEQKKISAQRTLHHRKAETAYKVLHEDVVMSKSNPTHVVLCIDLQQKFLVSGHRFLPCDRDFALIERRKKKSTVYHPKQWLEVIVNANLAFSGYYMDKEDFIDLSAIEGMFKKQSDFKIKSFLWIQFSSEEPNTVRTRVFNLTRAASTPIIIRLRLTPRSNASISSDVINTLPVHTGTFCFSFSPGRHASRQARLTAFDAYKLPRPQARSNGSDEARSQNH